MKPHNARPLVPGLSPAARPSPGPPVLQPASVPLPFRFFHGVDGRSPGFAAAFFAGANAEAIAASIEGRTDKQNAVYAANGYSFSLQEEGNSAIICYDTDES